MKKLLLTLTVVAVSAATMYGQGRVLFSNSTFVPSDAVTIAPDNQGPDGGNTGDGLGNDKYAVQLLWAPGTYANQAAFDAAAQASAVFANVWLVNTGPLATFSGFFDAGTVVTTTTGLHTVQALAFYNVGFATYGAAAGAGKNVGKSTLVTMNVTASPTPINTTPFTGFTVGATVIPEPSTFALAGLGLAGLLIFRRRK